MIQPDCKYRILMGSGRINTVKYVFSGLKYFISPINPILFDFRLKCCRAGRFLKITLRKKSTRNVAVFGRSNPGFDTLRIEIS